VIANEAPILISLGAGPAAQSALVSEHVITNKLTVKQEATNLFLIFLPPSLGVWDHL
jgi:hypothetical protein